MDDRRSTTDVFEVLERMRPGLDRLGAEWPEAERDELVNKVLSDSGSRQRLARRAGWIGGTAAAAALLVAVLLVPQWLGVSTPIHASPVAPQPTQSASPAAPALVCEPLDGRELNDLQVMNQTYHGVDPEDGVVASAKVEAGGPYSVIASRLTTGETTAWLAWETDFRTTSEGEVSYALHLAEITSGHAWDGGPAPYGRQAVATALSCVG